MEHLPWLDLPLKHFLRQLKLQQLPHAILLPVEQGFGGAILAQDMAQAALCQNATDIGACGHCRSCQLFAAKNHPDFYTISADGQQIKVEQIRSLSQQLSSTSSQGGYRVALINQCERLNQASANALLKTLEEPGSQTLIILQADIASRLLATISSRCQRVPFQTPSRLELKAWLANFHQSQSDVTWCLPVVGGPLILRGLLQSGQYQQLLDFRRDWAKSLSSGHIEGSLQTLTEVTIINALQVLYLLLRQHMIKQNDMDAFKRLAVAELANSVMLQVDKLLTMSSVNYLGLCQQFVGQYRAI
ncbi:DNA polymerase III subunit delta' [Shewanella marina]|uniref:DNA polymerase III subunit delta' n=1 Tax=Shewanella marina TaxID=487319 RepID=UPI00046F9A3E|nr:DNA polymerase III subunit delta' [Shewanella marina]